MAGHKREVAHQPLTDREWMVLQLVAEGLSNQEIAGRLSLSLTTVKWYLKQIFNKLGADRRTQAVKLAKELGLVETESPAFSPGPFLPAPVTPLIGREREVAELSQLLSDPAIRLVTLLGPGGIGKTHLALEVARQQIGQFPGSVCFVALDGVSTPSGVIPAVAEAIGFQFSGPLDSRQQLLGGLRGRRLLLVLDNFEHLLDVAPFVGEMLTAAPHLKILTTTRARLDLRAETVYALGGLAYLPELDPAQEYPAFKVFVQAAHRSQPDLQLSDDDVSHVTRICRLVEGMPLGLELAATWMHVLTPEQIADEIAGSLAILETTLRDVPERHRSIYIVFEHSWRLLSDEERIVFQKLSIFRGGFDRAAAKEVTGASLFMLGTLVDKSLIVRVGPDRFKLHELLRQCAEDKLRADVDNYRGTLHQHCQYFANLMAEYEGKAKTDLSALPVSLMSIQKDLDNILAGWRYALEAPLIAEFNKYVAPMSYHFAFRGPNSTGEQIFMKALRQFSTDATPLSALARVRTMTYYGWFLCDAVHYESALQILESAQELTVMLNDSAAADVGILLGFLGLVLHLNGKSDVGRERLKQGLALCQAANFQFGAWVCTDMLGTTEYGEGRYESALQYHQQALADAERERHFSGVPWTLGHLGYTCCALGDIDRARDYLRRALMLNRTFVAIDPIFRSTLGIAALYERCGHPETGLELLGIIFYHPQCGGASTRPMARALLAQFQSRLPTEQIESIMDKAKRGHLSSRYLDPQFTIDPQLTDRLLQLLDEAIAT